MDTALERSVERGRGCHAGVLLVLLLGFLSGCNGKSASLADGERSGPYLGDTLSLSGLVEAVNANNQPIESLWASGYFEANLSESREAENRFVNGDLVAIYIQPDRLRLKGTKPGVGDVFDLGSNGESFWLYLPTENLMYLGTFAGLDPQAARQLPVRPDLVLEVLGIAPLDTDLLQSPAPSLRFNPDSDAYMVTYTEPITGDLPPRLGIVREVWYDRETLLPTLVILFDLDGRPVLRAYLSRHAPIGGDEGPMVATRYNLYFPDTGSTLQLDLDELMFKRRGFPRPTSFNPPPPEAVGEVIDLDRPISRAPERASN